MDKICLQRFCLVEMSVPHNEVSVEETLRHDQLLFFVWWVGHYKVVFLPSVNCVLNNAIFFYDKQVEDICG
jgi:hypothetical protein